MNEISNPRSGSQLKLKRYFHYTVFVLSLTVLACTNNDNEILQNQTMLELARTKSDLDGIFIAVNNLIRLGDKDPSLLLELERVKKSLKLFEHVRESQNNGDYEKTILFAHEFLEYYPNNIEVRSAFRESGQIYRFLNESLVELQRCFIRSWDGQFMFSTGKIDEVFRIDYEMVTTRLRNAQHLAEKVIEKDQHVDTAVNLRRLIVDARIALNCILIKEIFSIIDQNRPEVVKVFEAVCKDMQKSLNSRFGSPQKVWKQYSQILAGLDESNTKIISNLMFLGSFLNCLGCDGIQEQIVEARNAVMLFDRYVQAVIHPRGNLLDYQNDVAFISAQWAQLSQKYHTIVPRVDHVVQTLPYLSRNIMEFCLYKSNERPDILQIRLEIIGSSGL